MQSGQAQAARIHIDALPYIDPPVPEDMQSHVEQLIEEEMAHFAPPNYLEHLPAPPLHLSPLLTQEFERVRKGVPLQALDVKRYEIPQPSAAHRSDVGKWREAVDNAHAQLEHQCIRSENLDLLNTFGKSAWLQYNQYLEALQAPLAAEHEAQKRRIDEVNRTRKSIQLGATNKLRALDEEFQCLAHKNVELQVQCDRVDRQIKRLRKF